MMSIFRFLLNGIISCFIEIKPNSTELQTSFCVEPNLCKRIRGTRLCSNGRYDVPFLLVKYCQFRYMFICQINAYNYTLLFFCSFIVDTVCAKTVKSDWLFVPLMQLMSRISPARTSRQSRIFSRTINSNTFLLCRMS